jgi:uncharacterized membrane protein
MYVYVWSVGIWQALGGLYRTRFAGFVSFLQSQLLSVPSHSGGVLQQYRVDGVSIQSVPFTSSNSRSGSSGSKNGDLETEHIHPSVHTVGVVLEGTVRSLSNLLEHLHQSFTLYLLASPHVYYSYGEYIYALVALVVAIILRATLLFNQAVRDSERERESAVVVRGGMGLCVCVCVCVTTHASLAARTHVGYLSPTGWFTIVTTLYAVTIILLRNTILRGNHSTGRDGSGSDGSGSDQSARRMLHAQALLTCAALIVGTSLLNYAVALVLALAVVICLLCVSVTPYEWIVGPQRVFILIAQPLIATSIASRSLTWVEMYGEWHAAVPSAMLLPLVFGVYAGVALATATAIL